MCYRHINISPYFYLSFYFIFTPHSIYLRCMNIIYLSLNIELLYHIQSIALFCASPNIDLTLYFNYPLYSIYHPRVNIFHLFLNFNLSPNSNVISLITYLTFHFLFSPYKHLSVFLFIGIFSIHSYSIYLQCAINIYLSPNIKFVCHIQFIVISHVEWFPSCVTQNGPQI